ncbi:methyl-accepting chemotaxis protein [Xanthomonas sontii]|uniref:Methyl-accepting chemotaxis protein n=2 Tax=Xanthomonas TaxID=338 RepID=A0A6N7Q8B3_9XANT|nr:MULTISPECIES: methyl-accepting chemotaxis protein [Xanthomonas]MRH00080.1 methyl-accepting chemotaxis protein [Xanthomonas sontii]MRH74412.1 methyl-accepting chemotaxis protein [Xanthomonas sontii]
MPSPTAVLRPTASWLRPRSALLALSHVLVLLALAGYALHVGRTMGANGSALPRLLPALLVAVAAAAVLVWLGRRSAPRALEHATQALQALGEGRFEQRVEVLGDTAEVALLRALQNAQQALAARQAQTEAELRHGRFVIQALDDLDTMVRIADDDGRVHFANRKLLQMLKTIEPDVQRFRPEFRAEQFVGGSIGDIYPDSQAAIDRMRALTGSKRVRAPFFGRQIDFVYSPIDDADGRRLGTIAQWEEVTAQVNAEQALATVIEAAAHGDFSQRIETAAMDGVLKSLAEGVNRISDGVESNLAQLAGALAALAEGDLTHRVDGQAQGVFARLREDTNRTVAKLTEIIVGIQESADTIRRAASEIAAGNTDLSDRTEQQAASLEETASSMEELTSAVKQNADNAQQANGLVQNTGEVARSGGQVMDEVVATMRAISTSSQRIGEIIGVIDGIAFQTNILALNAAVEAARAGEQGRGFAVVASEVRSLAQRSADAAKEIKDLIEASTRTVGEGAALVNRAGATMHEIVGSVQRVTGLIGEISAASGEQSSGIEQVNRTVAQLDEVTQRNAALVEEATAAARSMEEQAGGLAAAVAVFRIETGQGRPGGSNVTPLLRRTY